MPSIVQGTPEALEGYGDELAAPMLELRAWAAYFGADRCAWDSFILMALHNGICCLDHRP